MALQVLVRHIITDLSAPTQGLDLVITVWNQGSQYAIFQDATCSWPEWYQFDRAGVSFPAWNCYRNVIYQKLLSPNEKVVHPRFSVYFDRSQPQVFDFRIGLIQPVYAITQAEIRKAYREKRLPRELSGAHKRRQQTTWSVPVRVHCRTSWRTG